MKKILIYVLLLYSNNLFSQSLDYSISPFLSFSNENLKNSYGLYVGIEYIQSETYGLKLSAGLFSPDNSTENVFLIHMPTTITWLDLDVKIYPLKSYFSPYFGVGVGKYFITREWDGNAHGIEGMDILHGDLDDNIGYHLILGSKLYKSLHLEFKYLILKTNMNRELVYHESGVIVREKLDVNLNTLFVMISFVF